MPYRMFGETDQQIAGLMGQGRRAYQQAGQAAFTGGLRGLAQSASNRGLGGSGAIAMGVPSLQANIQQQMMQQEAALREQEARLRAQRTYQYRRGIGEQLLSGGMNILGRGLGRFAGQAGGAGADRLFGGQG